MSRRIATIVIFVLAVGGSFWFAYRNRTPPPPVVYASGVGCDTSLAPGPVVNGPCVSGVALVGDDPVPGAIVVPLNRTPKVIADAQGRFFIDDVEDGGVMVQIHTNEAVSAPVWLPADSGETQIQLERGGAMSGQVWYSDGTATVTLYRMIRGVRVPALRSIEVNEDGVFRISGLSPGTYQLHVANEANDQFIPTTTQVVVVAGTDSRVGAFVQGNGPLNPLHSLPSIH